MPSPHLNHKVRQWYGVQNCTKLIGLYNKIIFVKNDTKFLKIEWRTPYPLTILKAGLDCVPQLFF